MAKSIPNQIYTGETFKDPKHMARYGNREWLLWVDKDGKKYSAAKTPTTIKTAMLATGTQRNFWLYYPDGIGMIVRWDIGALMLRNAKVGVY